MTFRHWAGVSSYTSACAFAETCVFDKQLLGPLHCGHVAVAPLLPKLRGHFAEFLNNGSPVRLRIFFSSTCVGLRYGHLRTYLAAFLASVDSFASLLYSAPRQRYALRQAYFTACQRFALDALFHPRAWTIPLCHCLIHRVSAVRDSQPVVHHLRLSASA